MAELCLGTVQFGMKYGIANTLGQPSGEDVFLMLDTAIEHGIHVIDTARAYGTAEIILGEYFESRRNADSLKVISKLCPNVIEKGEQDIYGVIRDELENTLSRLHLSRLNGYLLHTPQYVYDEEIIMALQKLKEEKLVEHIGISIYDLEEGYAALDIGGMDYIQLPYSILDQRGIQKEFIQKAKGAGATVFTRSAFLQGLFMMDKQKIPTHLQHVIPYLKKFESLLEKYSADKLDVLIHFVADELDIDYLVFGVDTREQLLQDINSYQTKAIPQALVKELKESFFDIEKSIIFPSLWSNGKKAN